MSEDEWSTDENSRPQIEVRPGKLHSIADRCERVLRDNNIKFTVVGNKIMTRSTVDSVVNVPVTAAHLSDLLSQHAEFGTFGTHRGDIGDPDTWSPCDPPTKVVAIIMNRIRVRGGL